MGARVVVLGGVGLVLASCTGKVPAPTGPAHFGPPAGPGPARGGLDEVLDDAVPPFQGVVASVDGSDGSSWSGAAGSDPSGAPLDADDSFRLASVTKTFTAALVLLLVQERVLSLEDSVATWVPELPSPITVRHLLSHRSGLPDYLELTSPGAWSAPVSHSDLLRVAASGWNASTAFDYSNTNYVALGVLVERVTRLSFAEALRQRLLDPLGLDATYLEGYEGGAPPAPGVVFYGSGYAAGPHVDPSWSWAAGGLVSTTSDLRRFVRALFVERTVLSPAYFYEMTGSIPGGYGLGVGTTNPCGGGGEVFWHNGLHPSGACTFYGYQPSTGVLVVALSHTVASECAPIVELACRLAASAP